MILEVHAEDPEFGYRFIADELRPSVASRCERIGSGGCAEPSGIHWSTTRERPPKPATVRARRCMTTWCNACSEPAPRQSCGSPTSPNTRPSRARSTAVRSRTCSRTGSSATRSVERDDRQACGGARASAIARRQPHGTVVVHSDRGGQFRSPSLPEPRSRRTGSPARWVASPPPATTPPWNRSTHCCRRTSSTVDGAGGPASELAYEIVVWIEHTYNRRRRQRALGKLTPRRVRARPLQRAPQPTTLTHTTTVAHTQPSPACASGGGWMMITVERPVGVTVAVAVEPMVSLTA